ncbi:unnamed protein product [Meloidogyne enterolobii]|uniref:Uncharacterized protein n=1 Tax=Meloidogyne enterolobii TaxID=390850 RepID=A0ACB1AGM0_MELEN
MVLWDFLFVHNYKVLFLNSNFPVWALAFISEFTVVFLKFCQYPVSLLSIYTICYNILLSHFFHIQIKFGLMHFVDPLLYSRT